MPTYIWKFEYTYIHMFWSNPVSIDMDQTSGKLPQVIEIKMKHECPKVPPHC
ncbi:hypothetical protein EMIT0357P_20507 [Pseudomonas marginalis]